MDMINNDFTNSLKNFFNRNNKNEATGAADIMKRLQAKRNSIRGNESGAANEEAAAGEEASKTAPQAKKAKPNYVDMFTKSKDPKAKTEAAETEDDANLTAEEKRQKSLQKILEKLDAEEAQRHPNRNKTKTENTNASAEVTSGVTSPDQNQGVEGFLNELPLFNEFKTSLMDAFKNMDSGTSGFISAQYELNYSSMQTIATAGGGYEYRETTVNLKFDLNYVKAAAGGMSGADIAKAIEGATDFDSLMNSLEAVGKDPAFNPATAPKLKPEDLMSSMKDYFSPEKTSERILDFATSFFPLSDAFKKGGDTEESRAEFAEMMRKAVQKGFDQAMGTLGTVPKATQDGIDKTHELVFKGFDDFVKNGMNRGKTDTYNALQQLSFNFEMNMTQKSVSVTNYNPKGEAQSTKPASTLDAQA